VRGAAGNSGLMTGNAAARLFSSCCLALAALLSAGCGGGASGDAWNRLQEGVETARSLAARNTPLSFREELTLRYLTPLGDLEQKVYLEGALILPDRERYEQKESWSGSLLTEEEKGAQLSYVTLDGGKTAYIKGTRLEEGLGAAGWLYLKEPAESVGFLDYLGLLQGLADEAVEVREEGVELVGGRDCLRLELWLDTEAMLRRQLEADPAFRMRYEKMEEAPSVEEAACGLWLGKDDHIPARVYSMMVLKAPGKEESFRVEMKVEFFSYGEPPRPPIDGPAVYTVVE
jgi:hypothetical protein